MRYVCAQIEFLKGFLKIAGVFYFALLIYIFFLAKRRPRPSLHWGHHRVNYNPLSEKIRFFAAPYSQPKAYQWIFYTDLLGNIAIFIPFVLILYFSFGLRGFTKLFLIAVFTSIAVECTQFFLDIGVADVDDVILNSIGAMLGILIIKLVRQSRHIPFERLGLSRY